MWGWIWGRGRITAAIAVVERMDRRGVSGAGVSQLAVRHLERVPLGTPYPGVVERVREIVRQPELAGQCALAVDATGVGAPVVDMLRAARLGCEMAAVTITGGEQAASDRGTAWSVPKRDLMAGVQVLLEQGELKIARGLRETGSAGAGADGCAVDGEGSGRVRLGADGCGEHDDLVIALALACWRAKRPQIGFGPGRLPGI